MAGFSDHFAALDAAVGEHLCDPGVVWPAGVAADAIPDVPVQIDRPTEVLFAGAGQGATHAMPTAQVPVSVVGSLRKGDLIIVLGKAWRVEAAPTRPGDGRWWVAAVAEVPAP